MKWTTELHKFNSPFKKNSFLCPKELFSNELRSNNPFLIGAIKNLGFDNLMVNNEIALQKHSFLEKFKDSKILIIGAGPSAEIDFDSTSYDYIWSCNHFFKNEKIKNLSISLATLGNEVDLRSEELLQYLQKNETIICFENKYTKTEDMSFYKQKFPNRVFWAFTRYHSRIGSVPRLACIAASLGAKQIDFIGMDGYVPKEKQKTFSIHSFEKNKKASGTIEDSSAEEEIMLLYKEQYLHFWDYMLHDIGKDIKFKNLGHNHPCNLSTVVLQEKLGNNYQDYLINRE